MRSLVLWAFGDLDRREKVASSGRFTGQNPSGGFSLLFPDHFPIIMIDQKEIQGFRHPDFRKRYSAVAEANTRMENPPLAWQVSFPAFWFG